MSRSLSYLALLLAQVFLINAWAGELNFTSTTASVAENATSLTITVSRTGDATGAASVSIASTDGTAKASTDYTAVSSTLNWTAGNSDSKTVDVTITDNAILADDKLFTLGLSSVTGDTIGAKSTMSITITDYEEGILQFNGATFQAAEDSKVARIKVVRTSGTNGAVGGTISFADATALKDSDYLGADTSVTIADGDAEVVVEIVLLDDSIGEATETFTATLSTPTGGATLGTQSISTVEIFDTDADFTTDALKIVMSADNVTQPDVVDLNQASVLNGAKSFIELINEIPLLATSKLSVSQPAGGLVEIPFGDDKFYLRPNRISRNVLSMPTGVWTQGSNAYRFVTIDGHIIDMQPATASITSLQSSLEALSMPNLVITDEGNITIQKEQGVPKIERNDNGELVLSKSFYDRWHIRPVAMVSRSSTDIAGLFEVAHPTINSFGSVALYFDLDGENKMQLFTSAPFNPSELELAIRRRIGYIDVSFEEYGILTFKAALSVLDRQTISIIPEYTIGKVQDFSSDLAGFFDMGDLNGDDIADYKMIYSNGDEQIFYGID